MTLVKFDVDKFDGQNGFKLWHIIKMRALLWRQGMTRVSKEKMSVKPFTSTKEEEEKTQCAFVVSFQWSIAWTGQQRDCPNSLEEMV